MARNIRREPAPNPSGELIQLAIDLDLTALARSLPALLERAENHSPSFTDFGLQMFRAEVNDSNVTADFPRLPGGIDRWIHCAAGFEKGEGSFQGSSFVLARLPSFLGFSPGSLAF